jgi:type II secretion system protein J
VRISEQRGARRARHLAWCGYSGFTLIEVLTASVAFALMLAAVYGVFSRATRLRENASARTQEARLQARAVAMLRDDLRHGLVTGGRLGAGLEGSAQSSASRFPGYLRFTTTTGRNLPDAMQGDIQEVEYYIEEDRAGTNGAGGVLVRTTDRNLLASVRETTHKDVLLSGVQSMEVAFLDGLNWIDSWELAQDDNRLPDAVRVRLRRAIVPGERNEPRPIEIFVPCTVRLSDDQMADGSSTNSEGSGGPVPGGAGGGATGPGTGSGGGAAR